MSKGETMLTWFQRRRAAKADREFRDGLRRAVCDQRSMRSISAEQRYYAFLALRAMDWWIATGRAGQQPPETPALARAAPSRDKIIAAYLREHATEDPGLAFRAIAAQARRLGVSHATAKDDE